MGKITTTRAFETRHAGLAARLAGIASSLFLQRGLTLHDADEVALSGSPALFVRRGENAMLAASDSNRVFVYSDCENDLALAGLLARIGEAAGCGPIAADPQSLSILGLAQRLAQTDLPILITGPTGTGKEVLSKFIHQHSPRKSGSFVAINCAAIPETMLEAMLFGHQKGAFTGASAANVGFMREADGGTLLLDEIAEMPMALQAKLLRALQEGEIIPVGSTRPVKIDARIIACANRNLPDEVAAGRFREDLFYRLNVFPLQLPALRDRPADIAPLAHMLLLRHGQLSNGPLRFSRSAITILRDYRWPGNVRELENVIRRALVLAAGQDEIDHHHICFDGPARLHSATDLTQPAIAHAERSGAAAETAEHRSPVSTGPETKLSNIVRLSEARAILDTLKACGGKRLAAARKLGISERTLRYRLADFREAGIAMESAL